MKWITLYGSVILTFWGWSCDICGGVPGNASIGLMASTQFHMIGLKSTMSCYRSYLSGILHSREFLLQQELTGRWQLAPKWQIMASIPYQFSIQQRDLGQDAVAGFGDPSWMVNRVLVHRKDSLNITRSFLSIALGVKVPLGKRAPEKSMIRNLYPGTGAWNLNAVLLYTTRLKRQVSWQQEGSISYKFSDSYGFRYGNTYSLASTLVWNRKAGLGRLILGAGLRLDDFEASTLHSMGMSGYNNQGVSLSSQCSLNYMGYRWLWGVNLKNPLVQNFNQGSMKQGLSASLSISYLLISQHQKK